MVRKWFGLLCHRSGQHQGQDVWWTSVTLKGVRHVLGLTRNLILFGLLHEESCLYQVTPIRRP